MGAGLKLARLFSAVLGGALVVSGLTAGARPLVFAQAKAPPGENDFQLLADKAASAERSGDSLEAIRLYVEALHIRPRWAEGWRNLGVLLDSRKDYGRAKTAFENFLQVEPRNGSGWALLGLTEYEQGSYEDALRNIAKARHLGISNPDLQKLAIFHEALLLIHKSEFEAAEPLLIALVHAEVDDPDLVTALGLDALRIPSFPSYIAEDQSDLVEQVGSIDLQGFRGKVDEASAGYEKLLADQPRTKSLHYAYGKMLLSAGQFDRCLAEFQKELELNPNDEMALLQIATTELTVNKPEQSLPFAEKAATIAPKLFATHYVLGRALDKLGKTDRAIKELETAEKLAPSTPEVHYALFQAYSHANRKSDALRESKIFADLQKQEPSQGRALMPP